jgi:endoglucanase
MVVAASVVVAVGSATGMMSALEERRSADEASVEVTSPPAPELALPAPSPSASASGSPSPSASASPSAKARKKAEPKATATGGTAARTAPVSTALYRFPSSNVLDWVRANPGDPRRPVIESRIAARPAAVWFTDPDPSTITGRVRAVTSGAAAQGRVPVVVAYAIPDRDCGGASRGGAADLAAYDAWIDRFAQGLGSGEVVVILEPDSVAQADCLSAARRGARFASLARAGRVIKQSNPRARVYFDAGHSGWHSPSRMAELLRQAGAASAASSDGVFSNVSNFHRTADEIAYDRRVLAALGAPASHGAVIDTSRNGNGAPPDGEWCDPAGRSLGRAPTLSTGESRVHGYLWIKLPGESDGCRGAAGSFSPSYAYELATN